MIPMNSALSRLLVPWLIRSHFSAHNVTLLSLFSGVTAGSFFARGGSREMLAGAIFFLFSNLLDECDGKVARQTGTCSSLGAFLDTVTDCIVHAALFLGLGIGMARQFPQGPWLLLGWVAAGGSILSCALDVGGVTPWQPPSPLEGYSLAGVAEWLRIDFSFLVLLSAFVGHIGWILWAGALGVFLFWIPSTFWIALTGRRKRVTG